MNLYPAIDLKDGAVVRLEQGRMDRATVFNADPAGQADIFAAAGCSWLHVVDLNGAFAGKPVNAAAIAAILRRNKLLVQLGGGIRDLAAIEYWLEAGVCRVVLGTLAVTQPDLVRSACKTFPGRIALGIDARDGEVKVAGWAEGTEMQAIDLARRFEDAGAAAIIYTDIERDGMLAGVNVAATAALAQAVTTPVIASGGVASIADIKALKAAPAAIEGVIVGRALYDGRIDLKAALALCKSPARP
jgi:phosphoribosylformimino-5-aminoimidazole carboxamide ribotide isomerase